MPSSIISLQTNPIFNSCIQTAKFFGPGIVLAGIASAITSLFNDQRVPTDHFELQNKDKLNSEIKEQLTRILVDDVQPQDKLVIKKLVDKIAQCPSAKQLWENINANEPINLYLASPKIVPSRGFWSPEARIVAVDRTLQPLDHKLQSLLYELCNANKTVATELIESIRSGEVSQHEYLKRMLSHEYETSKCHHKTSVECQKSSNWDPRIDERYGPMLEGKDAPWRTAELAFQHILSDPSHEDYLKANIQNWNHIAKIPYCNKNPQAPECF